jgi:hypothetical protein
LPPRPKRNSSIGSSRTWPTPKAKLQSRRERKYASEECSSQASTSPTGRVSWKARW